MTREHAKHVPAVDILESDNEYLVIADMPGVAQNAIQIDLKENQLAIDGEKYARSFELPEFIDRDRVSAELKHGVLTVHLPKSEAVKPRQIEVRAG
jgi:HSP20 family molecular chaperone IbpA